MMELKYYYDDALSAAYMAKHFGIKLLVAHTDGQMIEHGLSEKDGYYDWYDSCYVNGYMFDVETIDDAVKFIEGVANKLWVHPGSESVFVPQVDDWVCLGSPPFCIEKVMGVSNGKLSRGPILEFKNNHWREAEHAQIIMRDGIPFIWPKVEE